MTRDEMVAIVRDDWKFSRLQRDDARDSLIRMFAKQNGWKESRSRFSADCLARHNTHGRYVSDLPHTYFDHSYFFRDSDGRASAIVAHLYNCDMDDVRKYAESVNLSVDFPDFPSWWYPGATTLVVYTPRDIIAARAIKRCRWNCR